VALLRTDVSEELSASFIRATRIGELGTTLAVTNPSGLTNPWVFYSVSTINQYQRQKMFLWSIERLVLEADNFTDFCEPII
jgi:hypothetical protein